MTEEEISLKFVLLGQEGVGKTSIARKFCLEENFSTDYVPTVGMDIYKKTIVLGEYNINIDIYDVHGSVLHNRNLPNLLHNSDALLFVYDVRHKGSFFNLKEWNQVVKSGQYAPICALIGHKSDLTAIVKIEDLESVSKDYHITLNTAIEPFPDSINNAFVRIAKEVLSQPEDSFTAFNQNTQGLNEPGPSCSIQ